MAREPVGWWRGLTLTERVLRLEEGDEFASPGDTRQRPPERSARWRSQFPFADPGRFAERLAADRIDEAAFTRIMRDNDDAPDRTRAGSATVPEWARMIESVYASWQPSKPGRFDMVSFAEYPTLPLMCSLEPLIEHVVTRLRACARDVARTCANPPFDADRVPGLFVGALLSELQRMVTPTMILRLNVLRLRGELDGDGAGDRFQSFISQLREPEFVMDLLREYPVLARLLVQRCETWLESSLLFLRHLASDWDDLAAAFSPAADLGPLVGMRTQVSDSHRGGRTVVIARFGSGRQIVYKPRSLALDLHFQQLLDWVNQRIDGPRFPTLTVLDSGEHGWVEFAEHANCQTDDGVRRFYERQGGYLALLYLLAGTDIHCENVLASGEYPIIVDLEALFHPAFYPGMDITHDPAASDLRRSVIRAGLLPGSMRHDTATEKLDRSGLVSAVGTMTSFGVLQPEGSGTDELRLVRKRTPIRPTWHMPAIDGREVDHVDGDAVIRGFENGYRCLLAHRDELLRADGPLARFRGDETRVVLRNTVTYSKLLSESFHPDVLRDALDRDQLIDTLWAEAPTAPWLARVIPAEQADLWNGDVPVFTTRVGSRDIASSTGQPIVGFVDESADVLTRRSLERLGEADLDKQRWFVHSSLCTLNPGGLRITRRTASPTVPDHDGSDRARLIGQARAIGDRLAVLASVSGGRAGWNGLVLAGRNDWLVRPSGSNLYDGTAGIVLFLAYLAAVTDEERYRDLARFGAASLYDGYLHIADTRPEIGLFNGRGGLIYLCTHLATLWDDDRYLDLAYSAVDDLQEHVGQDQNYDIISGAAGCIGSLLALWRAAPSDALLRTAVRCGDHLLRSARPITGGLGWPSALSEAPLAGFSHGAAGIASALVALTRATTDTRFRQAAVAALGYERGLFDETTRNWADLRTVEGVARNPESTLAVWCHGAAGVGLSRVAMLRELDDGMVREEITHAAETTLATGFGDNHSLCHGDLGNLDFIFQAADALDNDAWRERAHDQLRRSLADIERNGWRCGIENSAEVPGLMTGLAGIGLGLLRLAEPHRVPSVLLASAPAGMPAPGRHQQMPDEVTTTGGASA